MIEEMEIEDREYGSGSTQEEIDAIKARVYLYKDDIIVFNQLPKVSAFSTQLLFEKVKICARDLNSFSLIIDISNSSRPNANYRAQIKKKFKALQKLKRVAVIAKKYSVLMVAARFISTGVGLKEFVVRDNFEQALEFVCGGK